MDKVFAIGGNKTEFSALTETGDGPDFVNNGMVQDNVIPEGFDDMNFAPPLVYYKSEHLVEKIQNFIPPIK